MTAARLGVAWRFAVLGGLGAGLALSPAAAAVATPLPVLGVLATGVALARPRGPGGLRWLCLVAAVAVLAGLGAGAARLAAIDAGALAAPEGETVALRGVVVSTPRQSNGTTRFILEAEGSRIGVELRDAVPALDEGRLATVSGSVRLPAPWEAQALAREGAARVVVAQRVRAGSATRGGLRGALDDVRRRAEAALERGTPEPAAALLRGFVLGQDDRISEAVRDEFRRSGLAHVLAVSGQNVMLLALLATPILALAGVPLRMRLVALVGLIAIYVPVAGAGASIQRAGVMGAAGLVAALAGRPRARWYALLLAAVVTLALNPRATGDVGWQLSFAAVAGLLVLAAPIARLLAGPDDAGWGRRALAEGAAMTLAATLATAPLAAHHFGTLSLTALPANLLALPAIAPAMWFGMLAGALGQLPGAPVEPLTALGGLCAGFIGWVARLLGGARAQLEVAEPSLGVAIAATLGLLLAARLGCLALARRRALGAGWRGRGPARVAGAIALAGSLALAAALVRGGGSADTPAAGAPPALVLRVLDVGQGDAILLEPRGRSPILVDTGPPGGGAADRLADLGIERLAAVAITHDQLDHSGALSEVFAAVTVERILVAGGAEPAYCDRAACPRIEAVGSGQTLRAGRLRLDVLWPPPALAPVPADDPNARSLVLRARLGAFDALLAGDAEAELAPVRPGPVELLKVAHHGSADAGLPGLLADASPQRAVISVGAANGYGHPAPESLAALADAGVPVLRTDVAGEIAIHVRNDGWTVG